MQCPECGGEFVKKKIVHSECHKMNFYIFKDTPAWVCSQCGAEYLEPDTTKEIDYIINNHAGVVPAVIFNYIINFFCGIRFKVLSATL